MGCRGERRYPRAGGIEATPYDDDISCRLEGVELELQPLWLTPYVLVFFSLFKFMSRG